MLSIGVSRTIQLQIKHTHTGEEDQHLSHGIRTKDDYQGAPHLAAIVFVGEDSNAQCD